VVLPWFCGFVAAYFLNLAQTDEEFACAAAGAVGFGEDVADGLAEGGAGSFVGD
jgi:hypothetical protein